MLTPPGVRELRDVRQRRQGSARPGLDYNSSSFSRVFLWRGEAWWRLLLRVTAATAAAFAAAASDGDGDDIAPHLCTRRHLYMG